MSSLLDSAARDSALYQPLLLAAGLVFFWLLEGALPLYRFRFVRLQHAARNLILMAFQLTVAFSLAFLTVRAANFTTEARFGLLYQFDLPLWLHLSIALLLLDFIGAYLIHWLQHQIRWMWRFHLVHHTDQEVDVTTGLRHHPIETLFRWAFSLAAILIVGIPIGLVLLYQSISVFFAHFSHANFRTPERLDLWLSYLFVTPRFHRVHHHYVQPYTDSNYGNIFSLWDRVFGTANRLEAAQLRFGIDTHLEPAQTNDLLNLLALPFQRYRSPRGSKFPEEGS